MSREDVVIKIKKLLALADSQCNKNEAVSAALKAQRLIADYGVSQMELHDAESCNRVVDVDTDQYRRQRWRGVLAAVIAPNFRCKAYSEVAGANHQIHFYGYETDAKAEALVYGRLAKTGEMLARLEVSRYRSAVGHARGVKNTFLFGFVDGVREELEKQAYALMLVVPDAVERSYEAMSSGFRKARRFTVDYEIDASAIGKVAGREAVRAARLEDGEGMA